MKKTHEQEYRDAFNGVTGAEPAPAGGVGSSAEDDVTGTADDATPTEGAAEGATETPAVAVVITGEEGDDTGTDGAPAEADAQVADAGVDAQREKSWEGRLRAKEAELKAREAALAEREAAVPTDGGVVQAKDGCKVEMKADGGEIEGEDGQAASDEATAAAAATDGAVDTSDGAAAPSDEDIIAEGNAIYGPEFETYVAALIRKNFAAEADPVVGKMMGLIDAVAQATKQGFESMQMDVLDALIDDLEEITESGDFATWLDSLPDEDKAQAQQVVESGTIGQVKRLVQQFAASRNKESGPTAADIWAEDAATAVKGNSPVRLPDRPAMSPEDEYRAAFNAA